MKSRSKNPPSSGLRTGLGIHFEVLRHAARKLSSTPVSSLMTVFVIGIALLLPVLLFLIGSNLSQVGEEIEDSAQISLYLYSDISEPDGRQLSIELDSNAAIEATEYVSRQQALDDFSENADFAVTLETLSDNPLPASILVTPLNTSLEATRALYQELADLSEVEIARIDLEWLQRLAAIRTTVERTGLLLALILCLAVIFVVGNTIRLGIDSRLPEIQVIRLVGGTDRFISRPFLYTGFLLGMLGACAAATLVFVIQAFLGASIDNLLSLYGSAFEIRGF